jgi:DNA-binding protein HU-beta
MNKAELVKEIAKKTYLSKTQSEETLNAFTKCITECLKSNKDVKLIGFGTFGIFQRKARKGRNPRTGKTINIPALRVPKFKPGKALKEAIR